jgi:hypothetical protein
MRRTDANVDRIYQRLGVRLIAEELNMGTLFRGKDPNSGKTSGFSTLTMPLSMMC